MPNLMALIQEGGNAFSGLSRINKDAVNPTIDKVESEILRPAFGNEAVKGKSWVLLGSAGKKETSGDLDIAFSSKSDFTEIARKLTDQSEKKGYEVRILAGLKIVTIKFPIYSAGKESEEFVQVDMMVTKNLPYTEFFGHVPEPGKTNYKTSYRNHFLRAIAQEVIRKEVKGITTRYSLSGVNGINLITTTNISATGKPIKNPRILTSKTIASTPIKILKLLLGQDTTLEDGESFESVLAKINSPKFPYKNKRRDIINRFKQFLTEKDLPIPKEVQTPMKESMHFHDNEICRTLRMIFEASNKPTPKELKMRSIPHIQNVTIDQLMNFLGDEFSDEDIEVSEKCLDGDTIIETLEFGDKIISDIVDNNLQCHVKSFDIDSNEIVFKRIIGRAVQENNDDWYEIELEDGKTVIVTGNHGVYLPELKCFRETKNLQPGDNCLIEN